MDLDRYLATHKPDWQRLSELAGKGGRRAQKLNTAEISEMVGLYQRASSNLSFVRTYYGDPALVAQLTRLVSSAGSVIYGTRPRTLHALGRFFSSTFPAAVWHYRRYMAVSALLLLLPALMAGVWITHSHAAFETAMPADVRDAYVNNDFEAYYDSNNSSQFGSTVFTNNVQVAVLAFGSGILFGIPTVFVLVSNGFSVGVAAGIFQVVGQADKFWTLILPHGMLELSAIVVAGGAGLALGWSFIRPGDRSRSVALIEEARRLITIVLGLVVVFGVAGTIEGFVTGQPWSAFIRVGIGAIAWSGFMAWMYFCGRKAEARGYSGTIGEGDNARWALRSA